MNFLKQFTTIYHTEYGKGHTVGGTPNGRDTLYMVYFPSVQEHDWVLHSRLSTGTDETMSLQPIDFEEQRVSDDLQEAITNLFFGGQPQ